MTSFLIIIYICCYNVVMTSYFLRYAPHLKALQEALPIHQSPQQLPVATGGVGRAVGGREEQLPAAEGAHQPLLLRGALGVFAGNVQNLETTYNSTYDISYAYVHIYIIYYLYIYTYYIHR